MQINGERTAPASPETVRPGLRPVIWVPALMLIVALILYAVT